MGFALLRGLIVNASLLLASSMIIVIYNYSNTQVRQRVKRDDILAGLIIGAAGILLMMNSIEVVPGIVFDTRSILIGVTGLFFGLVPTLIASVIVGAYRIILGGDGTLMGVMVIAVSGVVGLLWRHFRLKKILGSIRNNWLDYYLFGLAVHAGMLSCVFLLPRSMMLTVFSQIAIPVLVIYPIGTMLLCMVVFSGIQGNRTRQQLEESEKRFRQIFEQAPVGISVEDDKGDILYYNPMFEKITGRTKEQEMSFGWKAFTHPEDLEQNTALLEKYTAGEIDGYSMQKRYIRPDGGIVWVNLLVAPYEIGDSGTKKRLCMIQDITEIKKTEQELRGKRTKPGSSDAESSGNGLPLRL